MKKLWIVGSLLAIVWQGYTQAPRRAETTERLNNISISRSIRNTPTASIGVAEKRHPMIKAGYLVNESDIGETKYDKQSNHGTQNRIYKYPDGTIGAAWMMGFSTINDAFPDRGTGYNYFDGTSWGTKPLQRIETMRTGWPSYCNYGTGGEIFIAHSTVEVIPGLVMCTRNTKGTGSWTQQVLTGPSGHLAMSWPRVVTSGPENRVIHLLAVTEPVANGGTTYLGQDGAVLYSRSPDGGTTWDIQHKLFPELDSSHKVEYSADVYSWASPKGDTLAFVIGSSWTDMFIMKSTDGGQTFSRKTIFVHPYPEFKFSTTLITDTPAVADGSAAIALDNTGKAHVLFGRMRVNHTQLNDTFTFFPYTDGLVYWNEDMPAFTTLDLDTLDHLGALVGFCQDYNNNDSMDFIGGLDGLGEYVLSLSGMPSLTIDEDNNIFILYSSLMENRQNAANTQNYRHISGRASFDGGATWSDTIIDLTGSIIHNFDECIYPSLAPLSDNFIHYIYHLDDEPGLAISGDEDPYTDNHIYYAMASKQDFGLGTEELSPLVPELVYNYPNPFSGQTIIDVNLRKTALLQMKIFDITGRMIYESPFRRESAGIHQFVVDGTSLQPGLYIYSILADKQEVSRKMIKY